MSQAAASSESVLTAEVKAVIGATAEKIEASLPWERLWWRRASAGSLVKASKATMAARLKHPQRSLREAPTGTQRMMTLSPFTARSSAKPGSQDPCSVQSHRPGLAHFSGGPWPSQHKVQNYDRGVAKKLNKSKVSAPFWSAACHDWVQCKIKLALFVQCNILPFMRAVARAKSRQVTPIDPTNAAGRRETR